MVTVSGTLSTVPSLTMSWATYVPDRSATNVGFTTAASESAATLPAGRAISDQLYVRALPSTSLDALPFRETVAPTNTD